MENSSNPWKIAFLTFFIIVIGTVLLVGGWILAQDRIGNSVMQKSPAPSIAPSVTPSKNPSLIDSGIPVTKNTVSFTRSGNALYLQYKGKVYEETETGQPKESARKLSNATWYGLVNTPEDATGFDEIFSFKSLPNSKSFVFVIRYDLSTGQNNTEQYIKGYYYNPSNSSEIVSLLFSYTPSDSSGNGYSYPVVRTISPNGTYASFDMFSCWNCGGHQPETMLVNLHTKATKRIGKTSYFAWKENGSYEYKEYLSEPCPTPTGTVPEEFIQTDCPQDPATLPLKTGSI